jgi:N-methylhydantoinase B
LRRSSASSVLEALPNCAQVKLSDGETILSICCGGGGYGDPTERSVDLVEKDLKEGWISAERASKVYGIVLDSSGAIDRTASERTRSSKLISIPHP